jgi:hypothetical protein
VERQRIVLGDEVDADRHTVGDDVEDRGGPLHVITKRDELLTTRGTLDGVAHADRLVAWPGAILQAEEGTQVEIALDLEGQFLNLNALRGRVVRVANRQARC